MQRIQKKATYLPSTKIAMVGNLTHNFRGGIHRFHRLFNDCDDHIPVIIEDLSSFKKEIPLKNSVLQIFSF